MQLLGDSAHRVVGRWGLAKVVTSASGRQADGWLGTDRLVHVHLFEAEAVEQGSDGGAGVSAGGVENAVGEGRSLQLLLGLGAGVRLEVRIGRNEDAGGTNIDAGVLVVDGGKEDLRRRQRDMDRLRRCRSMRTSSGFSLARSMPAIDCPCTTSRMRSPASRSGRTAEDFDPSTTVSIE